MRSASCSARCARAAFTSPWIRRCLLSDWRASSGSCRIRSLLPMNSRSMRPRRSAKAPGCRRFFSQMTFSATRWTRRCLRAPARVLRFRSRVRAVHLWLYRHTQRRCRQPSRDHRFHRRLRAPVRLRGNRSRGQPGSLRFRCVGEGHLRRPMPAVARWWWCRARCSLSLLRWFPIWKRSKSRS